MAQGKGPPMAQQRAKGRAQGEGPTRARGKARTTAKGSGPTRAEGKGPNKKVTTSLVSGGMRRSERQGSTALPVRPLLGPSVRTLLGLSTPSFGRCLLTLLLVGPLPADLVGPFPWVLVGPFTSLLMSPSVGSLLGPNLRPACNPTTPNI